MKKREKQKNRPENCRKKWPLILLVVLLAAVLLITVSYVVLFLINDFFLDIEINGEPSVTIEYGDRYEDPGAKVWLKGTLFLREGRRMEELLCVSGDVREDTLGTYTVTYSARCWNLQQSAGRTVRVVDTQAPTIELISDPDGYTLPGQAYEEEGFTAWDNYDGDLTDRVVRSESEGIVTYFVQDSAGNTAQVERQIVYYDPDAPVLELYGDETITLPAGSEYLEPGYRATDACQGDLTELVQVEGTVDIYRAGTYTIQYTVTDAYGNTTSATRTVTVKATPQPEQVTPSGKVIYLTFDDGPGKYTAQLLEILEKYNVKATFFVVNSKYTYLLPEIAAAGHSIGIHSATHQYKTIYASEEAYFQDLNKMKDIIEQKTGLVSTLVRFPGGSSNTVSSFNKGIMTRLTQAVQDMGYQYFDWNVTSGDAGETTDTDVVVQNVISGVQKHDISVVLQHDTKGYSVEAVERIIIWGLENGYTFLPLDASSPTCHHRVNN